MGIRIVQRMAAFSLGLLFIMGAAIRPQAQEQINVLAFYTEYSQMWDAAHAAFSKEANAWFPTVASENGFTFQSTTEWWKLNSDTLAKYQVVMFFDNLPYDGNQRNAFKAYMENGGGWIGMHVCAFNQNPSDWDWYFNQFLGMGSFTKNTWWPTTAVLDIEDPTHPVAAGLPVKFTGPVNEWYAWQVDLRTKSNIRIISSINPESFPLGTDPNQSWYDGYYPVIWCNNDYKMLYTNIGHEYMDYGKNQALSHTFENAEYSKLILNTIKWIGTGATKTKGGPAVSSGMTQSPSVAKVEIGVDCIGVSLARSGLVSAELTDVKGRVIRRAQGFSGECRLATNGLSRGAYFLRYTSEGSEQIRKVVIK
jgi:hypothetical protein